VSHTPPDKPVEPTAQPPGAELQSFVHKKWHRFVVRAIIVVLGVPLVALLATVIYITHFDDRVYPGVYIGNRSFGGLKKHEVRAVLADYNSFLSQTGFNVSIPTSSSSPTFRLVLSTSTSAEFLAHIDIEATLEKLLSVGRPDSWVNRVVEPWKLVMRFQTTTATVTLNEENILRMIKPVVSPFELEPRNSRIIVSSTVPFSYNITPSSEGTLLQYQELLHALKERASTLSRAPFSARLIKVLPEITTVEVEQFAKTIPQIIGQGPITLIYSGTPRPKNGDFHWIITEEQLGDWLEVAQNAEGDTIATVAEQPLRQYLDAIVRPDIDQNALDARFLVENNRVKEFEPGQSGLSLDATGTIRIIEDAVMRRGLGFVTTTAISVLVNQVVPTTSLAGINSWGIVDVLGAGSSTFKDSHTNRIKNIANAVKRLNGVLIAPGEEFSTNKFAGPYTESNGFLPEMVIKGNEIKPEVGGGMCQIGTTVFRTAMNSGLPITQRHNHSLVVSYYADPVNHNPGTDATLYEPTLDLKFLNDTGNYILLAADIDYKRQLLTFTLWGKSDGRSGSYTRPIVKRWIAPGKDQEIVSQTAPAGSRKCQNAFRGAEATFTYTRFTSTSEKIERVFDSYYRPLPRICVVGPSVDSSSPSDSLPSGVVSPNPADPVIDTVAPPST
jgi:vancomycin resistance protein YoaR